MAFYKIETSPTVVLRRYWHIEAASEDEARDAFEADQDNATFRSEETTDMIGDEDVIEVTPL